MPVVAQRLKPDLPLMEKLIRGFSAVINQSGGISPTSGPQIEQALLVSLVQLAFQRGIQPQQFTEWADTVRVALGEILPGMWARQPDEIKHG